MEEANHLVIEKENAELAQVRHTLETKIVIDCEQGKSVHVAPDVNELEHEHVSVEEELDVTVGEVVQDLAGSAV